MLELQNTLISFFEQFTPNVRIAGEDRLEDGGIDVRNLPMITFSYPTSGFSENAMMTFDIWSHSTNWIECLSIEDKLARALPSQSDVLFEITSGAKWEYRNNLGVWVEFDFANVQQIVQQQANLGNFPLETRETKGESRGGIWLQRGNPFTQSVTDPDFMIKRRTGNIIIRNFTVY